MIKKPRQTYNINKDDLLKLLSSLIQLIKRDKEVLLSLGIDEMVFDQIDKQFSEIDTLPDDKIVGANKLEATRKRKQLELEFRNEVIRLLSLIKIREDVVEGAKDFQKSALYNIKPTFLIDYGEKIAKFAAMNMKAFKPVGVTSELIMNINIKLNALKEAQNECVTLADLRNNNTIARTEKLNALYKKVKGVSEIAKNYWKERNDQRYNDFVIYKKNEFN